MKLTPDELEHNINELIAELQTRVPEILTETALAAKSMVQRRIQDTGMDATGKKMEDYSDDYAEYRVENGRQIGHVDLNFHGQMWGATGLIAESSDGAFFTSKVGGRDVLTKDKLRGNSDKRGDVLRVSREEEKILSEGFEEQVMQIVDKYLG